MSKKFIKKLLEDIKLLQVNFIMIYIIHKISVLLKITRILKRFLIFGKWIFLAPTLRNSYIFFLYFKRNFQKLEKEEFFCKYFAKWNFLAPRLKKFLNFSKKIFISNFLQRIFFIRIFSIRIIKGSFYFVSNILRYLIDKCIESLLLPLYYCENLC